MTKNPGNKSHSDKVSNDEVVDGGRIGRTPTAQTIMAVGFLILVTLISFLGVTLIGQFMGGSNQVIYWMIELIFALLCGGAGALVGGSAKVRSTLKIPGSPVQATLGGAISMVIVGFAVAYLGRPPADAQTYALEIHGLPNSEVVDGVRYNVFVGTTDSNNVSFTRYRESIALKIPSSVGDYGIVIAIYQTKGRFSETFARCRLSFSSILGGPALSTMQIVPERDHNFRLYLRQNYITKVVRDSLRANKAIQDEPCVEGVVATKKSQKTPLRDHFTILPTTVGTRLSNAVKLNILPRYAILASDAADIDPQDTLPDLPPKTTVLPGHMVASQPPSTPSIQDVPNSSRTSSSAKHSLGLAPAHENDLVLTSNETSNVPAATRKLYAQVDEYVSGKNNDRTQLYQSWHDVADYVVRGFRTEFNKGSPLVARYVNLISNALVVIDNGKYLAPTRRPDWDESIKPTRLLRSNNIPGFKPGDYKKIVSLLCSSDTDTRIAARRMLRLYPGGRFYEPLQAIAEQNDFEKCDLKFVSETAIYYYYNRIVEYDGSFTLDQASRDWINGNYNDGAAWVKLLSAKDPNQNIFIALLDYGVGLVLWDHNDRKHALNYFNSMLKNVGSSGGVYPSNPRHLAIALREIHEAGHTSKIAASATPYDPNELYPVGTSYALKGGVAPLLALPDRSSKQVGRANGDQRARVYLRADHWDLIQVGDKIGWAQRSDAVSRN